MNTQNNSQVTAEIRDVLKLQVNDRVPDAIPVFEVNPKLINKIKIIDTQVTSSSASTLLAANPDVDIYIHSIALTTAKDASATSTSYGVTVVIDGATKYLLRLPGVASTAAVTSNALSFPVPIKIDRNTPISWAATNSTAYHTTGVNITYHIEYNSNA